MTDDRPGSTRREVLKTVAGMAACGAGAFTIVHYLTRHDPRASETVSLGPVSQFAVGSFQQRQITVTEEGVWTTGPVEKTLWIRRNPDDSLLIFSGTCPHMNCTVNLQDDQTFVCPCHQSSFAADGTVLLGPSPRPLDTLAYRVDDGMVLVEYRNFQKGIPEKKVVE